jgi:hypothetical protein
MLLVLDLHEDFIDVERVAISSVPAVKSAGIYSSESDTPETDRFSNDCDASFSQQVFDIAMAQAIRWESVAFINSHQPILPISASELGDTVGIHSSVLAIWES